MLKNSCKYRSSLFSVWSPLLQAVHEVASARKTLHDLHILLSPPSPPVITWEGEGKGEVDRPPT